MADIVSQDARSRMMSQIRCRNTKPEVLIRTALHRRGIRYRLHKIGMPGKPDIVLPKYKAVIFVHGCFWHCHKCHLFKWPQSNSVFWRKKLTGNRKRDGFKKSALRALGWRVFTLWECAIRGADAAQIQELAKVIHEWLCTTDYDFEVGKT